MRCIQSYFPRRLGRPVIPRAHGLPPLSSPPAARLARLAGAARPLARVSSSPGVWTGQQQSAAPGPHSLSRNGLSPLRRPARRLHPAALPGEEIGTRDTCIQPDAQTASGSNGLSSARPPVVVLPMSGLEIRKILARGSGEALKALHRVIAGRISGPGHPSP